MHTQPSLELKVSYGLGLKSSGFEINLGDFPNSEATILRTGLGFRVWV